MVKTLPRPVMSRIVSSSQGGPIGSDRSAGLRSASRILRSSASVEPSPTSWASAKKAYPSPLTLISASNGPTSLRRRRSQNARACAASGSR